MFGFGPEMIYRIPALLIALTIHEYAHARVAVWLGDHTPRTEGRLTLNPLAHLDPYGLIALFLIKFGWAKPVRINPYNFKDFRMGSFWVALAGPGANILVALFSAIMIVFLQVTAGRQNGIAENLLYEIYFLNVNFAVFNLIPIPPLDGSKILSSLAPDRVAAFFDEIEPYGMYILMGLIFLSSVSSVNILSAFAMPLASMIENMINFILLLIFRG